MTRIAVIIPTVGRSSLDGTFASLAPQLALGDRVMVMCDRNGIHDTILEKVELMRYVAPQATWRCYPCEQPLGEFGHPQRNRALDILATFEDKPDLVWSLDDDDEAAFGALDMIRAAAADNPGRWMIFRMRFGPGHRANGVTVWHHRDVKVGNVGTPMIVSAITNCRFGSRSTDSLGRELGAGYCGDIDFAEALVRAQGDPAWRDEIIAEIRPAAAAITETLADKGYTNT